MFRLLVATLLVADVTALQQPLVRGQADVVKTSRRAVVGTGAAAALFAFGMPVMAEEEYISPARAKILAAKAAAKSGESTRVQAVADSSASGRSGKAQ